MAEDEPFGSPFERVFVGFLAVATGLLLIYLAVLGPLWLGAIKYKTAEIINNQIIGQDAVNLFLLSPISIAGGTALFFRKKAAKYLLISTPLYLIYYVLVYTIGQEWSSPEYTGNSQAYAFHFLFILISSLIVLLYSLSVFPKNVTSHFKKPGLAVYSAVFSLFLLVFAAMWIKEVRDVMATGTTRGYDLFPTSFWMIRIFDLGFSIPLGFLSVYLLWTRPRTAYPILMMFYGFFLTMIIAVDAMGLMMFLNHDPTFLVRDMVVFSILAIIIIAGLFYIRKNYKGA